MADSTETQGVVIVPRPYNGHGIKRPFETILPALKRKGLEADFEHTRVPVDELSGVVFALIDAAVIEPGQTAQAERYRENLMSWIAVAADTHPDLVLMAFNPTFNQATAMAEKGVYAIPAQLGGRPYDSGKMAHTIVTLVSDRPPAVERVGSIIAHRRLAFQDNEELDRIWQRKCGDAYTSWTSGKTLWEPGSRRRSFKP